MEADIFNSKGYRRSRFAYVVQCAVEYMVTLLLTDSFLAKLLLYLGLDDATIGIVSSLLNFAFLVEFLVIPFISRFHSYKRFVIVVDTVSVLTYFAVYMLPFLRVSPTLMKVLVYLLVAGGPVLRCIINSMYYPWANAFVRPGERASFSAVKEIVSLVVGIIISLAAGYLMDSFEARGDLRRAFLLFGGCILAAALLNLVTLLLIDDVKAEHPGGEKKSSGLAALLKSNRRYRQTIISDCLHYIAINLTLGFLGTFKTVELGFSVWQVQLFTSVSFLVRIAISMPLGRYSDRHSFASGYSLAQFLALGAFLLLVFTTPERRWLMVAFTILYQVSLAANEQNRLNILYDYVPAETFVPALAFKNFFVGTVSMSAAVVGGRLLNLIQSHGNHFAGLPLYGQQVLALISCLFLLACIVFNSLTLVRPARLKGSRLRR